MKKDNNKLSSRMERYNRSNQKKIRGKKKKIRLRKWVLDVFLVILFVIVISCIVKLLFWNNDNKDTDKVIDDINEDTKVEEVKDDENTEIINKDEDKVSDYWYYVSFPLINVDIAKLKEKNSDTVGWISVNNTNINYPFVQYKDNDYYLNHSFDKSYNEAGWVYMDYRNNKDFNNKNTILYAHSRTNNAMFGSLSKVFDNSWYQNKDNHIIRISTETENTLWQVFSIYKIPVESYYITTNFRNDSEYMKFLNTIHDRSIYNFNTNLVSSDKILTLSTCWSDDVRTVVHAKLIKRTTK